jgi:hypothetical protein
MTSLPEYLKTSCMPMQSVPCGFLYESVVSTPVISEIAFALCSEGKPKAGNRSGHSVASKLNGARTRADFSSRTLYFLAPAHLHLIETKTWRIILFRVDYDLREEIRYRKLLQQLLQQQKLCMSCHSNPPSL